MMKKNMQIAKKWGQKMDVVVGISISIMYYYVLLIVTWKDSTYIKI